MKPVTALTKTLPDRPLEIWPGPMEGVSQEYFVQAANSLRLVERWMTPFYRVGGGCPARRRLQEFFAPFAAGGVPVYVQLMGTDAELIGAVAREFLAIGAAGINLNFGCPSRRVIAGGAGGGVLRAPDSMMALVNKVKNAIGSADLSVKLRAGFATWSEIDRLLPALAASGTISRCFLHYRTVSELYQPVSGREERFRRAAALLAPVPLIVNGDIASVVEGRQLAAAAGATGVMAARGWMRDPWLLRRFDDSNVPDPETGRRRFFTALTARNPSPGQTVELARLLWGGSHPETASARRRFLRECGKSK